MGAYDVIQKLKEKYPNTEKLTILDIGACDFSDSIIFKNLFPNSEVHGIEADKINFERHSKNANQAGVKTHSLALADFNGTTTFYPSIFETKKNVDWRYAGSICKPMLKENSDEAINHSVTYDTDGYEVKTMRLDTFCESNGISEVHCIHIDVEGAEHKVLSTMGNYKPGLIFAETHHYTVKNYDNDISLTDFDSLLDSLGYKVSARLQYDTLYEKK